MTVTAARLTEIAAELRSMAGKLDEYASAAGDMDTALSGGLDAVDSAAEAPRIDDIVGPSRDYLGETSAAGDAASSAAGTLRGWASAADGLASEMQTQESARASAVSELADPHRPPGDGAERLASADSAIASLRAEWQRACNRHSGELQAAMSTLDNLASARAMSLPVVPLPPGILLSWLFKPSAEDVAGWWNGLTLEEQLAVIGTYPGQIGNLDGVPAWARDQANRITFQRDLQRLTDLEERGEISRLERRVLGNLQTMEQVFAEHAAHRDPLTGEPPVVQLYIYDPFAFDGNGRVAISLGDLDTADHLAVTVPGLGTDVQGMGSSRSQNIYDESRWASGESIAVLDWIGYDAPNFNTTEHGSGVGGLFGDIRDMWNEVNDIKGVVSMDMARTGAVLLANDVAGIRAMRNEPVHLTVIGNSYGSTTTAIAASEYGLDADDVILTGSPGAGNARTAHDFTTGADNTWVGSASQDAVTYLGKSGGPLDYLIPALEATADAGTIAGIPGAAGGKMFLNWLEPEQLGHNPSMDYFGANRFEAEAVDRGSHLNFGDHGRYYDPGTESLYNVAAIVTGNYDEVGLTDHRTQPPVIEVRNPFDGTVIDLQNPFEGSSIGVQNPLEGSSVDVDAGICRGRFGVPYPCIDVDVDVNVQSPVDIDIQLQNPIEELEIHLQSPVDVNILPNDAEAGRTPVEMSHE